MRTVAIITARMGSARLPGKVLLPADSKPMLQHMIERVQRCETIDEICVATTWKEQDQAITVLTHSLGATSYVGSDDDVLDRVLGAAQTADADVVVMLTGDCPLIDPGIVDAAIESFKACPCDYLSNVIERSYPDGMDVQVFHTETLTRSAGLTNDPYDREHVTTFIRDHPEMFEHRHLVAPPHLTWADLPLVLDEQADYELIRQIIEYFGSTPFDLADILGVFWVYPQWLKLNESVTRTPVKPPKGDNDEQAAA